MVSQPLLLTVPTAELTGVNVPSDSEPQLPPLENGKSHTYSKAYCQYQNVLTSGSSTASGREEAVHKCKLLLLSVGPSRIFFPLRDAGGKLKITGAG